GRVLVLHQVGGDDAADLSIDLDRELGSVKIGDRLSILVDRADVNRDDLDAGPEGRLLRLFLGLGLSLRLTLRGKRGGDKDGSQSDAELLHGTHQSPSGNHTRESRIANRRSLIAN